MHSEKIMDCLIERLRAAGLGRWPGIAEATGIKFGHIRKIAYRERTNPGIKSVQTLLDYFSAIDRDEKKLPPLPQAAAPGRTTATG